MKAVIITLLFCFSAVLANESYDRVVMGLTRLTLLSKEKVEICVNQTQVTLDDMRSFENSFDLPEDSITDQASLKRATCTLSCCAQAKGVMVGTKFQVPKIHEHIDGFGIPKEAAAPIHQAVDSCAIDLLGATDECLVIRDFAKCLSDKLEEPPRIV